MVCLATLLPCCTLWWWGHCVCCFKESSFLPLHVHNADTPVSVSEFLKKHETEFFRVVNPRFSLLRLQRKGVISQDVVSHISAATTEEDAQDAQEILFTHLSCLWEYCELLTAANGYPKMQLLGEKMKEELQQGGWLE